MGRLDDRLKRLEVAMGYSAEEDLADEEDRPLDRYTAKYLTELQRVLDGPDDRAPRTKEELRTSEKPSTTLGE